LREIRVTEPAHENGAALTLVDLKPDQVDMRAEVLDGLAAVPKALPPKFFYDERGSALFEQITGLDDYYLTRTEVAILQEHRVSIAEAVGAESFLIEYGSGASIKIRILLEALRPVGYMPVDISRNHLLDASRTLAAEFEWLDIYPTCADYSSGLPLPDVADGHRRVAFFPGSSVGNFEPADAVTFLDEVAKVVGSGGALLIGVDTKKEPAVLQRAYDDPEGVTAQFNRNVLHHINDVLGANFDPAAFEHLARYDAQLGRIEMHLISTRRQQVDVAGTRIEFAEGEALHTESSYKYAPEEFDELARRANFTVQQRWIDARGWFAVTLYRVV
jgi:dimethylhistidine N-methyltransferase